MQQLVTQGTDVETVAATFVTTPAVVKQRLRLASVSPKLHEVYADDGMTLEQLMAFSVSEDHERQEQVWDLLQSSYNKQPYMIRAKLTEDSVRATDKRVRFVGLDAYVAASCRNSIRTNLGCQPDRKATSNGFDRRQHDDDLQNHLTCYIM